MKKLLIAIVFGALCLPAARGAQVDTLAVPSHAMNREVTVVAIRPDKAVAGEKCPVIYLLHGYSGDAFSWMKLKPELPQIADREGIIFICPDGENSWYWDSPLDKDYRYETFVAKELVEYVDRNFATRADRLGRAVTGLSMGGHGGMWLGIRHKETFGAAGSMSGGLDIRPFPDNWEMKLQLGEQAANRELWERHTAINQLDGLRDGELAIIIDCGSGDFFLAVNEAFHKKLLEKGIGHDFTVRPGKHDNRYWNNAIDYQVLFFKKFFDTPR